MLKILTAALFGAALFTTGAQAKSETALFAGGCFWCVESNFDHVKGVTETISGYAGGTKPNPTYEDYDGYQEAEKITYDPAKVSYKDLVRYFLRTTDVVDDGGQFCDRGDHYTSVIFAYDAQQKKDAEDAIAEAEKDLGQKVVTPVRMFTTFGAAEDYHQNYWQGTGLKLTRFGILRQQAAYERYRQGCGRDARVKALWGKAANSTGGHGELAVMAEK